MSRVILQKNLDRTRRAPKMSGVCPACPAYVFRLTLCVTNAIALCVTNAIVKTKRYCGTAARRHAARQTFWLGGVLETCETDFSDLFWYCETIQPLIQPISTTRNSMCRVVLENEKDPMICDSWLVFQNERLVYIKSKIGFTSFEPQTSGAYRSRAGSSPRRTGSRTSSSLRQDDFMFVDSCLDYGSSVASFRCFEFRRSTLIINDSPLFIPDKIW